LGCQGVIQPADRIGREDYLQDEIREGGHVGVRYVPWGPEQVGKSRLELLEGLALVERAATRLDVGLRTGSRAIAPPVFRTNVRHTPQALRGHGSLERFEYVG